MGPMGREGSLARRQQQPRTVLAHASWGNGLHRGHPSQPLRCGPLLHRGRGEENFCGIPRPRVFPVLVLFFCSIKKIISFSGLPIEMLKMTDGFRLVGSKNSPRQALGWDECHPRIYLFVFVNFSGFQNAPILLCVFADFSQTLKPN